MIQYLKTKKGYYYKLLNSGKKIRISKEEYENNKKGGARQQPQFPEFKPLSEYLQRLRLSENSPQLPKKLELQQLKVYDHHSHDNSIKQIYDSLKK